MNGLDVDLRKGMERNGRCKTRAVTIWTWLLPVVRENGPLSQEVVQTGPVASEWVIGRHESEYTI